MCRHCGDEALDVALRDGMFDRIRVLCIRDESCILLKCACRERVLRNGGPQRQRAQFPDHRGAVTVPDDIGHRANANMIRVHGLGRDKPTSAGTA